MLKKTLMNLIKKSDVRTNKTKKKLKHRMPQKLTNFALTTSPENLQAKITALFKTRRGRTSAIEVHADAIF